MCSYTSFRSGREEEVPRPRSAEQLLALKQKKEEAMRKGRHATGVQFEEDYLR